MGLRDKARWPFIPKLLCSDKTHPDILRRATACIMIVRAYTPIYVWYTVPPAKKSERTHAH